MDPTLNLVKTHCTAPDTAWSLHLITTLAEDARANLPQAHARQSQESLGLAVTRGRFDPKCYDMPNRRPCRFRPQKTRATIHRTCSLPPSRDTCHHPCRLAVGDEGEEAVVTNLNGVDVEH